MTADGPIGTLRTPGGRGPRKMRRLGGGHVLANRIGDEIDAGGPSSTSALMRWYSLNGVPRGSKNGSGASMRTRSGRDDVVTALRVADSRILLVYHSDRRFLLTCRRLMLHSTGCGMPHRRRATARPRRRQQRSSSLLRRVIGILAQTQLERRPDGLRAARHEPLRPCGGCCGGCSRAGAMAALGAHIVMMAVSVWRWNLLLRAQHVEVPARTLSESFWIASFLQQLPAQQHWRRCRAHRRHLEASRIENPGDHRGPGQSAARPLRAAGPWAALGAALSRSLEVEVAGAAGGSKPRRWDRRRRRASPSSTIPRLLDGAARAGARPRASVGAATFRPAPGRVRPLPRPAIVAARGRWPARFVVQ